MVLRILLSGSVVVWNYLSQFKSESNQSDYSTVLIQYSLLDKANYALTIYFYLNTDFSIQPKFDTLII